MRLQPRCAWLRPTTIWLQDKDKGKASEAQERTFSLGSLGSRFKAKDKDKPPKTPPKPVSSAAAEAEEERREEAALQAAITASLEESSGGTHSCCCGMRPYRAP